MTQYVIINLVVSPDHSVRFDERFSITQFEFTIWKSYRPNEIFEFDGCTHTHYQLLHQTDDFTIARKWLRNFIISLLFKNGEPAEAIYPTVKYLHFLINIHNFHFTNEALAIARTENPEMFF